MTVAVAVKVFDGIVLAADSASTLSLPGGASHVYNSANKIFHLHRGLPIGAMTWGLGNVGAASISTLAKDLRRRLMGEDPSHRDWALDTDTYTVEGVAERLIEHFYDELYAVEFAGQAPSPTMTLGLLVAGYSGDARQAEAWLVQIDDPGKRPVPVLQAGQDTSGWLAYAQPEATSRLFNGMDGQMEALINNHVADPARSALHADAQANLRRNVAPPAMPFADAIALAKFMVDVTVGYAHFCLGPDTVGGPVEVAGINRHEGFKWVERKHYYSARLNPEVGAHAND